MIQTISVTNDSFVYGGSPYTNYEGAPYLYIGNNSNVPNAPSIGSGEALLYFDLSQIPATSTIQSAQLKLYVNSNPSVTPVTLSISTLGSSFNPSLISWNMASTIQTTSTSDTIVINGSSQYVTGNVTDIVKNWVNGTVPNNGILLQSATPSFTNGFITIGSVNNSVNQYGPVLEIVYNNSSTTETETNSGDYNIIQSNNQVNGQNISTTYAIKNNGTEPYDKALAVLELNYNGQWYESMAAPVNPGGTAVITNFSGNNKSRLEIIGTIGPTLYSFVPTSGTGSYSLNPIIDVDSNDISLAEPYTGQVGLLYEAVPTAQTGVKINSATGEVTTNGSLMTSLNNSPVNQEVALYLSNVPSASQYNLTFNNAIYASTAQQITAGLGQPGGGAVTNIISSSTVFNIPKGIQTVTNYNPDIDLQGINTIYKDSIITSNKDLTGIYVDIYFKLGQSGDPNPTTGFTLLQSNVPLSGTRILMSTLTKRPLPFLQTKNKDQDSYKIIINPSTTATGNYDLTINEVVGPGSTGGITPSSMKYLDINNVVTLTLPLSSTVTV